MVVHWLLLIVKNPKCHYLGIEIDPYYAEIARTHCDQVLVADIDALPLIPCSRRLTAECWVFEIV